MVNTKPELTGEKAELLKDKQRLATYGKPITISGRTLTKFHIDEHHVNDLHVSESILVKYAHRRSKVNNSTFKKVKFEIASFSDSTLTNVIFEDSEFHEVDFIDSTFVNVIFRNCTFFDSEFMGLKGKVSFINSTLNEPDFYESQAIMEFENSTLTNAGNPRQQVFYSQKLPAAIYLKDSRMLGNDKTAIEINGALAVFKAQGGSVQDVVMRGPIGELSFSHATIDIALSGEIAKMSVDNSYIARLGFSNTQFKEITITDCQSPAALISFLNAKYDHFDINKCAIGDFKPWGSIGGLLSLRNVTVNKGEFEDSKFNELLLKDVTFTDLNLTNAQAKKVVKTNVTVTGTLNDTGSNIKLH